VAQVAADPRATIGALDIPFLPEESVWFQSATATFDSLAQDVKAYAAAFPDEIGGVYVDLPDHRVVALWTGRLDLHRGALLAPIGHPAPLQVRPVRYSERALARLQDQIVADWGWFREIDVAPVGTGVELIGNVVGVDISSADPNAPQLVVEH
jgi:hypothetical protein